jgi:hypothetical protein
MTFSIPFFTVQIFVRVRPFNGMESEAGAHSALSIRSDSHLSLLPHSDASQYVFDCIFNGSCSQETLFEGACRGICNLQCLGKAAGAHLLSQLVREHRACDYVTLSLTSS